MVWGNIAGAIGAAAIGGGLSYLGGEQASKRTRNSLREQMEFQERMYGTRYQTTMRDMRAAGLNPMLAYQTGVGSTPSGASATYQDTITPAVSSAKAALTADQELKLMRAETKKREAERWRTIEEERLTRQRRRQGYQYDEKIMEAAAEAAKSDWRFYQSPEGKKLREWQRWIDSLSPWISSAKDVRSTWGPRR